QLADTGGGAVDFASTVDGTTAGAQSLTILGGATFGGAVGSGEALSALSVGSADFQNGASVTTTNADGGTGNQTYFGAVTLENSTTPYAFTSTGGLVDFKNTVDATSAGGAGLTITGNADFGSNIGNTTPLTSVNVS